MIETIFKVGDAVRVYTGHIGLVLCVRGLAVDVIFPVFPCVSKGTYPAAEVELVLTPDDAKRVANEILLEPAPLHPFEVLIFIGGDDWKYVQRAIEEIAAHMAGRTPETTPMMSGGTGGSHSITVAAREISPNGYHLELQQWLERRRIAEKAAGIQP
jgi:hypothetical protein